MSERASWCTEWIYDDAAYADFLAYYEGQEEESGGRFTCRVVLEGRILAGRTSGSYPGAEALHMHQDAEQYKGRRVRVMVMPDSQMLLPELVVFDGKVRPDLHQNDALLEAIEKELEDNRLARLERVKERQQ